MATAVAGSSPATWKCADVSAWLQANELSQHVEAFKAHSVDGKLLLTLTESDMYSVLNIVSPLHRKKLAMAIAELRKGYLNP